MKEHIPSNKSVMTKESSCNYCRKKTVEEQDKDKATLLLNRQLKSSTIATVTRYTIIAAVNAVYQHTWSSQSQPSKTLKVNKPPEKKLKYCKLYRILNNTEAKMSIFKMLIPARLVNFLIAKRSIAHRRCKVNFMMARQKEWMR